MAAGIAVKEQVDFFVACGGGSPMDVSKAISLLQRSPSAIDHAEERFIIRSRCRAIRLQQSRPHP